MFSMLNDKAIIFQIEDNMVILLPYLVFDI